MHEPALLKTNGPLRTSAGNDVDCNSYHLLGPARSKRTRNIVGWSPNPAATGQFKVCTKTFDSPCMYVCMYVCMSPDVSLSLSLSLSLFSLCMYVCMYIYVCIMHVYRLYVCLYVYACMY